MAELERCTICGRKPGQTAGCTSCEGVRAKRGAYEPIGYTHIPVIPGVIPVVNEESLAQAMAEAHDALPYLPDTAVTIYHWPREEGLVMLRAMSFTDEQIKVVSDILDAAGPEAEITVATRTPHAWEKRKP